MVTSAAKNTRETNGKVLEVCSNSLIDRTCTVYSLLLTQEEALSLSSYFGSTLTDTGAAARMKKTGGSSFRQNTGICLDIWMKTKKTACD